MTERPALESRARAWAVAALWALGILVAIPLGRRFQEWVSETIGREMFLYVVFAVVGLGLMWAISALVATSGQWSWRNLAVCVAVAGCFVYASWERRHAPEEALHFVQYGVLGVLVFRALRHSIRDSMIYLVAVLTCIAMGLFDEIVQWLTPGRFFGFGDIRLNATAAVLSQLGIAFGLTPQDISWRPTKASALIAIDLSIALVVAFGLCVSNTPAAVDWYASKIPPLAFLGQNESVMSEFGYAHDVPEVGRFYSRLRLDELSQEDLSRAREAATVLDAYRETEQYLAFLAKYTAGRDPFLHEARVHLFSRDWHVWAATTGLEGAGSEEEHWTIAYRENLILERFFPETLRRSSYRWSDEESRELRARALPSFSFTSRTSAELVTGVALRDVWLGLGGLGVALALLRRRLSRELALVG